jgi:hypothetical protein
MGILIAAAHVCHAMLVSISCPFNEALYQGLHGFVRVPVDAIG